MKKLFLGVLCSALLISGITVQAAETPSPTPYENETTLNTSTESVTNLLTGTMIEDMVNSDLSGSPSSLQLYYAQLELQMAGSYQQQMANSMNKVNTLQNQQKSLSQLLSQLRSIASGMTAADEGSLSTEFKDSLVELGVCPASSALLKQSKYTLDDIEYLIFLVQDKMETLSVEVQKEMVYLQDYMGQYNSYVQNASTQISNAGQLYQTTSRSGSMYGNTGMIFTCSLLGAAVGIFGTLLVQFLLKKGKKA